MKHQLEWNESGAIKNAPDIESIKLLQFYEGAALHADPRGYCVCTSEGKDSRVLGHLMRRAGVKHFYLHSILLTINRTSTVLNRNLGQAKNTSTGGCRTERRKKSIMTRWICGRNRPWTI